MPTTPSPMDEQQAAVRRGVRRTVLVFVVLAVLIYVGFILTGVLAGGPPR